MLHEDFLSIVQHGWSLPTGQSDKAKIMSAKFKNLRRVLKAWHLQISNHKITIANVKLVLSLLEMLEDCMDLTIQEWNFKEVLANKLVLLLQQQNIYWKHQGTIKWVKFGDVGTKFFHANALGDDSGVLYTNHSAKATILWNAYKERLGVSEFQALIFDLHTLLDNQIDLAWLEDPFTHEEIDVVVAGLPLDKSPGPNGLNIDFVKKCWPLIKYDFYELCQAFYMGEVYLESINGSFVTLIPKVDAPTQSSQFRPISLLNISVKIITKLLANRLQRVITSLVHQNQYGFIKSKTIQDCLAWSFE